MGALSLFEVFVTPFEVFVSLRLPRSSESPKALELNKRDPGDTKDG